MLQNFVYVNYVFAYPSIREVKTMVRKQQLILI